MVVIWYVAIINLNYLFWYPVITVLGGFILHVSYKWLHEAKNMHDGEKYVHAGV